LGRNNEKNQRRISMDGGKKTRMLRDQAGRLGGI
jgi:hypothetical protein